MVRSIKFPNHIRELRKAKGIKLADVRLLTGICERQFGNYEHGDVMPTVVNALKIAHMLDCEVSALFDISDADINGTACRASRKPAEKER